MALKVAFDQSWKFKALSYHKALSRIKWVACSNRLHSSCQLCSVVWKTRINILGKLAVTGVWCQVDISHCLNIDKPSRISGQMRPELSRQEKASNFEAFRWPQNLYQTANWIQSDSGGMKYGLKIPAPWLWAVLVIKGCEKVCFAFEMFRIFARIFIYCIQVQWLLQVWHLLTVFIIRDNCRRFVLLLWLAIQVHHLKCWWQSGAVTWRVAVAYSWGSFEDHQLKWCCGWHWRTINWSGAVGGSWELSPEGLLWLAAGDCPLK